MAKAYKIFRSREDGEKAVGVGFYCPGCNCHHRIMTSKYHDDYAGPRWEFNEDFDTPTFSPSIKVTHEVICHSFVTNGQIKFEMASTHSLRGQTVDLPEPFGNTE